MKNTAIHNTSERLILLTILVLMFFSCKENSDNFRSTINLSGYWQFDLDSDNIGIEQKWFLKELSDSIKLPGTTDLNQKGFKNKDTTTLHLNRVNIYEGPAWYRKTINIAEGWQDHHIRLILERTKPSKIWIDDHYIGESFLLESPQHYDLSEFLTPGMHTITIRIDNNQKLTPFGNVHIYSDDTQTNWNGIIGDICLEASKQTYISDLQVYPDIDNKKAKVVLSINNQPGYDNINVELQITKELNDKITKLKSINYTVPCDSMIEMEYTFGEKMDLWDEYHQPVYKLNAVISYKDQVIDNKTVTFGMRKFAAEGTQFAINGRITFLRGKHDACVFPLTGHPPMDAEGWIRVFSIAKSYGINHYRFHSWCPPEAAFEAADRLGIYLQPELPFWGGLEADSVAAMLETEGIALLKSYANHPSFVMFSPGNEIWSGHERIKKIIIELKRIDGRPLYTQGSNNNIGYLPPMEISDFHIAARTPYEHDTILTHTRLTQAFVDSKDGGILNLQMPSTMVNFDYAVSHIKVPLIGHEIGQYQIYPDFNEIDKYTGVLKPWNLEVFRNRLKKEGMLDQNIAFTKASGAWSALCYKAEIEAAIRTEGFAGFQLLDLQDFPGQGTALVGIMDAFMDSKNVVSREEWLRSCNDVVPLLLFEKYCWTNNETFSSAVKVANYSNQSIKNKLKWKIEDKNDNVVKEGVFENLDLTPGKLHTLGKIQIPLTERVVPEKLTVSLSIENTTYNNSYPIWVYPEPHALKIDNDISIVSRLDNDLLNKLKNGEKVLLLPDAVSVKKNSVAGLFPPDFWNYGMFKGISEWVKKPVSPGTLGILTNPEHPIFNSFPTDSHTNWQWWSIIRVSNPLILNLTDKGYRPIVQVIDNMERNNKFGLIFEFKVGKGKLLVCMSKLDEILDRPEAFQLYSAIISYMKSEKFNPGYLIDEKLLSELLQ